MSEDEKIVVDKGKLAGVRPLANGIVIVAMLFVLAATGVMVWSWLQLHDANPLTDPTMQHYMAQLKKAPADAALKDAIRDLDLRLRQQYFAQLTRMRTGAIMLAVAGALGALMVQLVLMGQRTLPNPKSCPGMNNPFDNATMSRKLITGGMLWLVAIGLGGAFMSQTSLPELVPAETGKPAPDKPSQGQVSAIEPSAGTTASKVAPIPREQLLANWNGFRGPFGNAVTKRKGTPTEWDGKSGKNIIWKTKVPKGGFNSPVVWGNRVFLTGADKKERLVFCFDADNGKLLWEAKADNIPGSPAKLPEVTDDTGYAAASVTCDGERVYAIFGTGDILGLTMDGKRLWARNLGVPDNHYGYSSSLLRVDDKLIVQYDDSKEAVLYALSPATGANVWKVDQVSTISWSSPLFTELDGKSVVLLATSTVVSANAVEDGRELWSTECMGGEMGPSPAFANGMVYAANESACAVGLNLKTGAEVWKRDDVSLPDVSSVLAADRHVYLVVSFTGIGCLDAKTGKDVWLHEYSDEGFFSSPVLVNDLVYLFDKLGNCLIFKDADKYEEVGRPKLGDAVVTTPAFVKDRIYVRGMKNLYCIGTAK